MGTSTNAPEVTAQSRIRGSKFTGMVVLSLLLKTPREQTPSASAVTTGQVFIYSSCFKKTHPTYCTHQCASTPLSKSFLTFSLFPALFPASAPQLRALHLAMCTQVHEHDKRKMNKKLLCQSKARERGVETCTPFWSAMRTSTCSCYCWELFMLSPGFVKQLSQWHLPSLCWFRYCLTPNVNDRNPVCDYVDTAIPSPHARFLIFIFCNFK